MSTVACRRKGERRRDMRSTKLLSDDLETWGVRRKKTKAPSASLIVKEFYLIFSSGWHCLAICRSFFKICRDSALEEFSLVFTLFLGIPGLVLLLVEDEQVGEEEEGKRDEGVVVEVRPQKCNTANLFGFLEPKDLNRNITELTRKSNVARRNGSCRAF